MKNIVLILLVFFSFNILAQNKEPFKIYKDSTISSYDAILTACKDADFVFFGEDHDNPIAHWLEYELLTDLYQVKKEELIVGAEMFEADNQLILNEYLEDKIDDKKFQEEARLWPNYKTDYKPLIKFCKDSSVQFVATNIPRRYASMVAKKGFEILDSL
ncbi:MAG: iron-regulated protein, partial [Bacteroidetes bacterium CG_4_8_14_3_um_filter_31_14]